MKFCPKCNLEYKNDKLTFCSKCGNKLKEINNVTGQSNSKFERKTPLFLVGVLAVVVAMLFFAFGGNPQFLPRTFR